MREFFRSLGMAAESDVSVTGARTRHDVDVLVRFDHAGLSLQWIVECKHWMRPVSKLHVLALRTIVEDVGADRGILLSESAFQSGAHVAVKHSGVALSTFADLRASATDHLLAARLRQLPVRLAQLHRSYWDIPKPEREERGLRQPIYRDGYSGGHVLNVASDVLLSALADQFPPEGSSASSYKYVYPRAIENLADAIEWIDFVLDDLESRITGSVPSWKNTP